MSKWWKSMTHTIPQSIFVDKWVTKVELHSWKPLIASWGFSTLCIYGQFPTHSCLTYESVVPTCSYHWTPVVWDFLLYFTPSFPLNSCFCDCSSLLMTELFPGAGQKHWKWHWEKGKILFLVFFLPSLSLLGCVLVSVPSIALHLFSIICSILDPFYFGKMHVTIFKCTDQWH